MIREALWREIRRLFAVERWSKAAIAQTLNVDRKTVRACLAQSAWTPYQRAAATETLLTEHRTLLETRAPAVGYSAQVLYQELTQQHGYTGSYDTVKRFVRPLREAQDLAARASIRFETPPGLQSQIEFPGIQLCHDLSGCNLLAELHQNLPHNTCDLAADLRLVRRDQGPGEVYRSLD